LLLNRAKAYPAGIATNSVNTVAHVAIINELVNDSKRDAVSNFLYVESVGEKNKLDCVEKTSDSCFSEVKMIQTMGIP
jgi:dihydroorotase